MKQMFMGVLCLASALLAQAQEKTDSWVTNLKLSGYGMVDYTVSTQEGAKSNSWNVRMLRLALDGRVARHFYWKVQLQMNGNTSQLGASPRMVDLFAEWQRYKELRVKVGQFKRAFTFENPLHPIDQGFMSFSQAVTRLAGFNDRNGDHASNGRDIGLQLQGDLFPDHRGRAWLHYQLGVYNGQGINTKDVDQRKDLIGGFWVMPVEGLRIGAFGWDGSYARKGTETYMDATGATVTRSVLRSLPQHRYALSAEWQRNGWTARSEYIHSTGKAFKTTYQEAKDAKDVTVNEALGGKAEGFYALVIAPVVSKKVWVKARYDTYLPKGEWSSSRTQYEVGADYEWTRSLKLSAEWVVVNDRSLSSHNYSMADVQLAFRF